MSILQALRDKRAAVVGKMRALQEKAETEDRDFTPEEKAEYDGLEKEAESLKERITRASRLESHEAQGNEIIPAVSRGAGAPAGGWPDAKKEFESFGEFASAVAFNPNDQRLQYQEGGPRSEQRMDTGSSGGFMVPKQFISALRKADTQGAIIRPRATVLPAGEYPDGEVTMPALNQSAATNARGGVTVNWSSEGATVSETDVKLREITLKPHEMTALVPVTDKLLRNWSGCAALIESLLRDGITAKEEQSFLLGDGASKPLGILKSNALIKINRTTSNQVKYADICNMLTKIKLSASMVFQINQMLLPQLMQMVDPAGNLIWQASAREGIAGTLLGYPVAFNEFSPSLGTLGDLSLLSFGDYLIKDGSGPLLSASNHVEFKNNRTLFKVLWNVDGQPWLTDPLVREDGSTYSPFVSLDVPVT